MQVVDSHVHFWNPSFLAYPWLSAEAPQPPFGDAEEIRRNHLPQDYFAAAPGLDVLATVHIQAECAVVDALRETDWATGLGDACGAPTGIVAFADLRAPDIAQQLDAHFRSPRLRGIRQRTNIDPVHGRAVVDEPEILRNSGFHNGLRKISERGLLFELSVFARQLPDAAQLAYRFPDLQFVLNHLGWPLDADDDGFEMWRTGMRLLARRPNVAVKVSGLWPIDRSWKPAHLQRWVMTTLEYFGPHRCMWGSNLPIEKLMCPMPRQVDVLSDILGPEPSYVLRALFVDTASAVYRLR